MINIRKATAGDIPVLIDFQQRLAQESENIMLSAETLSAGMLALFADPAKGVYYVAEEALEILGCHMITYEWSDWRNGMVWWLQSVYVQERHRKKGIFKVMYENVVHQIRNDPSVLGLRLYVDKTNLRAQKAYTAMGMNGDHYTVFEWMK